MVESRTSKDSQIRGRRYFYRRLLDTKFENDHSPRSQREESPVFQREMSPSTPEEEKVEQIDILKDYVISNQENPATVPSEPPDLDSDLSYDAPGLDQSLDAPLSPMVTPPISNPNLSEEDQIEGSPALPEEDQIEGSSAPNPSSPARPVLRRSKRNMSRQALDPLRNALKRLRRSRRKLRPNSKYQTYTSLTSYLGQCP